VRWATENPNVTKEREVTSPGTSLWCSTSSREIFFEETVRVTAYLTSWRTTSYLASTFCFLMRTVISTWWCAMWATFSMSHIPGRWMGRRWSVVYAPRSPDLRPLEFYLWGSEHFVFRVSKNTTGPEVRNWNRLCCCSTGNNTTSILLSSTPLPTMKWCWWWSFWTFIILK
jgi:hypothetical protein